MSRSGMMLLRYNCSRKQTTATNDISYYTIRYDSQNYYYYYYYYYYGYYY